MRGPSRAPLGFGNFALKVDYVDFTDSDLKDFDVDTAVYGGIEGYSLIAPNLYLGIEVGYANPNGGIFNGDIDTDVAFAPSELNLKYAVNASPNLVIDFGAGISTTYVVDVAACAQLGLDLYRMPVAALPSDPADLARLVRMWRREAVLNSRALFLDADDLDGQTDNRQESSLNQLVESTHLMILSGGARRGPWSRPAMTFEVSGPSPAEQRALWQTTLGEQAAGLNGQVDQLVSQFNLPAMTIRAVTDSVRRNFPADGSSGDLGQALWQGCRREARPRLDDLAQRIEPSAGWDDLVLPQAQKEILREIGLHVRQRSQVYDAWDFRSKGQRGLGISALFAGASGTGKTMAAEVLATELLLFTM